MRERTIWKAIIAVLIAACILMLYGCAAEERIEGVIYEKTYEEGETTKTLLPIYTGDVVAYIPSESNTPERWRIRIKQENGATSGFTVSKDVFDRVEIGDWFSYDTETDAWECRKP